MKTTLPIYRLKHQAKRMAHARNMPLHAALDQIAVGEGFNNWGHLSDRSPGRVPDLSSAGELYAQLAGGDLVISAARPGQGKTLLAMALAVEAMKCGHEAYFFSLDYTELDVAGRLRALGVSPGAFEDRFRFDGSEQISAGYILEKTRHATEGTLVVVDYLQLLDQRRDNPDLMSQIGALRDFSAERGITTICISQVWRSFDAAQHPFPTLADIRLPNPLDLGLFTKACFLNHGKIRFEAISSPG